MKKILHILPANSTHLSIPIATDFSVDYYSNSVSHEFCFWGACSNEKKCLIEALPDNIKRVSLTSLFALFKYLIKYRDRKVLIHGDIIKLVALSVFFGKRINWICWGAATKTNNNLRSKLTYPIKWLIFRRLGKIVTLLIGDQKDLVRTYNLKNVKLLPYPATKDEYRELEKHFNIPVHTPLRVLVGNSGHNIEAYLQIVEDLVPFKDSVEIHFMFQYPKWEDKISKLRNRIEDLFSKDGCVYIDTEMMTKKEYVDYLISFDIYICHCEVQNGLGAIHNSLLFGKKVFLNGKNLEWEKELGMTVFDSKNIKHLTNEEFLKDITFDQKLQNRNNILKLWDQNANWLDLLVKL